MGQRWVSPEPLRERQATGCALLRERQPFMPCSGFLCARVPCTSGASESDPGGCREGSRQLRWVWPLSGCSSAMGGCHTRGGKDGRLFIGMRCFIASPSSRGLERLEIPRIPNCWAQFAGMLPSSCEAPVPLSLTKSTHSSPRGTGCRDPLADFTVPFP